MSSLMTRTDPGSYRFTAGRRWWDATKVKVKKRGVLDYWVLRDAFAGLEGTFDSIQEIERYLIETLEWDAAAAHRRSVRENCLRGLVIFDKKPLGKRA